MKNRKPLLDESVKKLIEPSDEIIKQLVEVIRADRKEIEKLEERDNWLSILEQAGVDNWQGIDYAYEMLNRQEEESRKKSSDGCCGGKCHE